MNEAEQKHNNNEQPENQTGYEENHDPLSPEMYPDPETETPADPNNDERAAISALQDQLDQTKDQMIRAVAEAENTRKRAAKEREDSRKYAVSGFAKDLLDVADNLRRALDAVPTDLLDTEPRLQGLVGGIEATERELLRAFEKNGIQKLEPAEEIFDPNKHEVMFETPGTGKPAGTIIQVMEPGYMLHDRLIRPARVGVAKDDGNNTPPPPTDPGGHIDTEA